MRIASLVPSATELIFAMGLGDHVVAVTHECDHPIEATDLPQLTASVIPAGLEPADVDALVKGRTEDGASLYTLNAELLKEEAPDLIVAQQLCNVCAVSIEDVRAVAESLPNRPEVISLDPTTIGEVLGDVRTIAQAVDKFDPQFNAKDAGVELVQSLADRIDAVKIALRDVGRQHGPERPTVAALEWLDPVFIGGHWVPQMIEIAGGIDLLGMPGEPSTEISWDEVSVIEPDVAVLMQCGYDVGASAGEAEDFIDELTSTGARQVFASDANAYFSRPGPRLVDGIELLAHALHPELVPEADAGRLLELDLAAYRED
jgi:iron complex transport system substrate-binding protein